MEPTLPAIESIYDILYADTKKIGTYLAQVDPNGVLTGIKSTASGTTTLSINGKASAAVVSGALTGTDASTEGNERSYDPSWILPITLMNRLDELGFIQRGLGGASIGSLVLMKGYVRLIDVAMMKDMWPLIGKVIRAQAAQSQQTGNRSQRRQAKATPQINDALGNIEHGAELLKHLPHAFEMHMATDTGLAWSTLNPASLLVSAADIALKHGVALPGEWHMLGLLDAHPGLIPADAWDEFPRSDLTGPMTELFTILQGLMGRPPAYHGVTPLILFREIQPQGTEAD
ncbi:MAG TPA: hypothetical protein VNR89_13410 [Roseomonas sp.]|nr:hypothetical protein [Roseomonas sp.]